MDAPTLVDLNNHRSVVGSNQQQKQHASNDKLANRARQSASIGRNLVFPSTTILVAIIFILFNITTIINNSENNKAFALSRVNPEFKMAEFVGTYKFDKDDGNFDELLKCMGVGFMTRKLAGTASPTIEVKVGDDGTFHITTTTSLKTSEISFKLGEEFEEKRLDGATVKTVITKDGNKLVQVQKTEPPVEIIREFNGDVLKTTCKCDKVTCVREYKKQ